MNSTRYDIYMQLDPAGTSVQNMNHWGQMVRNNDYCYYDYLTRHENEKVCIFGLLFLYFIYSFIGF